MLLLDTDVMVDIIRKYPPALDWLRSRGKEQIALPGFAVMELIQGSRNKEEQQQLIRTLKNYETIWPKTETCQRALAHFIKFHLSHNIGILDSLIGQISVDAKLVLYTFNRKHYEMIPSINISEPYERI